ncbi:S8 family serine peptidase [Candidatus Woesearchaeota archaeon]|nr:S8 family serine peptidase [Candidatus Woesearchaeota archaeon]
MRVNEYPAIQELSCKNNSEWIECEDIKFGFNITKIRVNCTYYDQIKNVSFHLKNIPDNLILINKNASYYKDGFWYYNTTPLTVNDSGYFNLTSVCIVDKNTTDTHSLKWEIPWGRLSAEISADSYVNNIDYFNVISTVNCIGGECQDIKAFLDPKPKKNRVIIRYKDKFEKLWSNHRKNIAGSRKNTGHNSGIKVIGDKNTPRKPVKVLGSSLNRSKNNYPPIENSEFPIKNNPERIEKDLRDITIIHNISSINEIAAVVDDIDELKKNPDIKSIREDRIFKITLQESVPLVKSESTGDVNGSDQAVCVVDTGVDYTHPALGGCSQQEFLAGSCSKVIGGYDFVNNDPDPMDDHNHGTHVAGIIASENDTYAGVSPGSKIVAMKACNSHGSCYESDIIASIEWCIQNRFALNISVISMSLGSDAVYDEYCNDDSMAGSVNRAVQFNLPVFIASGNSETSSGISSPACIQNAISVGSTTKQDHISEFTNKAFILDVLAPGQEIVSVKRGGGFFSKSGTSMAAPHAAGFAALLIDYYKSEKNRTLYSYEIKHMIRAFGFDIYDHVLGTYFPRINLSFNLLDKGLVPVNDTDSIFYTIDKNPYNSSDYSCLGSLKPGEICIQNWTIRATANTTETYEFFTFYTDFSNRYNRSEKINITVDNSEPEISINVNGTDHNNPLKTNSTHVYYEITDNYNIKNLTIFLDKNQLFSNASVNRTFFNNSQQINITPGRHNIEIHSYDYFDNFRIKSIEFFSTGIVNISKTISRITSEFTKIDVNISNSDNISKVNPGAENISEKIYDIRFNSAELNFSIKNITGVMVSWEKDLNISLNHSDFVINTTKDIIKFVYIDEKNFISENSTYYGEVEFEIDSGKLVSINYKSSDANQDLQICSDNTFNKTELPCYTQNQKIRAYVPHFSYVAGIADVTGPKINFLFPKNNSIINLSTGIYLNISTDETCFCNYTLNNISYIFSDQNTTFFFDSLISQNPFLNGNFSINVSCRDLYGNIKSDKIRFFINDTRPPEINITSPAGKYSTTLANKYNVPIEIFVDEYANVSYTINQETRFLNISEKITNKSGTIALATGKYKINVTAVDANNNSVNNVSYFNVSAKLVKKDNGDDDSGGSGGRSGGGGGVFYSAEEDEKDDQEEDDSYEHTTPSEKPTMVSLIKDDQIEIIVNNSKNTTLIVKYPSGFKETLNINTSGKVVFKPSEYGLLEFFIDNLTFYTEFQKTSEVNTNTEPVIEQPEKIKVENNDFLKLLLSGIAIFIVFITLAAWVIHPQKEETEKLNNIVKELAKDHSKEEIKKMMKQKGWGKEVIEKVVKQVKKGKK